MIKHFCDCCGKEMPGYTGARLQAKPVGKSPGFEIIISSFGPTLNMVVSNVGDFCKYCVIDAINALDDRPRKA